jgi:hypothetical protein
MRKFTVLTIIGLLMALSAQTGWADSTFKFKFPATIKYKLLKNNQIVGSCQFFYNEKFEGMKNISSLRMKNFEGLGFTSREWLYTYIFKKNSSIYADFIMKGEKPISEIRLIKDAEGFDGKKGDIFRYKDLESPDEMQTEIFTKHTVIDLLSMFYITSQRVAAGKKGAEKFNFLIDKSTKIVDMVPIGMEKLIVPFKKEEIPVNVFSFTYHNKEIFRVKIFKDNDGYCFPASIFISMDFSGKGQPLEIRADKVKK